MTAWICLGAVLLLSALWLAGMWLVQRGHLYWSPERQRGVALSYVWLTTIAMLVCLVLYLAFPGGAAREKATQLEHRGVRVVPDAPDGRRAAMVLTGDRLDGNSAVRQGMQWKALPSGARIALQPEVGSGQVKAWKLSATGLGGPARVGPTAVNTDWVARADVGGMLNVSLKAPRSTKLVEIAVGRGTVAVNGRSTTLTDRLSLVDVLTRTGSFDAVLSSATDPGALRHLMARSTLVRMRLGDGGSGVGLLTRASDSNDTYRFASEQGSAVRLPVQTEALFLRVGDSVLHLPTASTKLEGGTSGYDFRYDPPRRYPLPPLAELQRQKEPSFVISAADIGAYSMGYLLDTGNDNFPNVTKWLLGPDRRTLSPASDPDRTIAPGTETTAGDGPVTPIFAVADPIGASRSAWIQPSIGLFLFALVLTLAITGFGRKRASLYGLELSFPVLAFGVCLVALLVVRAILSYRVSMMPPYDLSLAAQAAYARAWPQAAMLLAYAVPLVALGTAVVLRVADRQNRKQLSKSWTRVPGSSWLGLVQPRAGALSEISFGVSTLLAILLAASKLIPWLDLPPPLLLISILGFSLGVLFGGLNSGTSDHDRRGLWSWRTWWTRNGMLVTGACIVLADTGALLFALPFIAALLLWGCIRAASEAKPIPRASLIALWTMGLAWLLLPLASGPLARLGTGLLGVPVVSDALGALPYRLLGGDLDFAHQVLADPSKHHVDPQGLVPVLQQRWQTEAYLGSTLRGYFQAPLSDVGMTYPTILSDTAFASLLVSEHGKAAAWLTLGLHVLASLALFLLAWGAARSKETGVHVLWLYALGGILGFVAVYMGLANLWRVPFTGQSVPLLAVGSRLDAVLYLPLFAFALLLTGLTLAAKPKGDAIVSTRVGRIGLLFAVFPVAIVLSWIFLGVFLARHSENSRASFNFRPETYARLEQALVAAQSEMQANAELRLAETQSIRAEGPLLLAFAKRFDEGTWSQTPIVADPSRGNRFRVDTRRLAIRSPYVADTGVSWRGSLVAGSAVREHQVLFAGMKRPIILRSGAGSRAVSSAQLPNFRTAQRIDFETSGRRRDNYGGIELRPSGEVWLRWNDAMKPASILVNGVRLDLREQAYRLQDSDVVSLRFRDPDRRDESITLLYLGARDNRLAMVTWRNGRYVRQFPQGSDFSLANAISQVADSAAAKRKKLPETIQISLDLRLQRDLMEELRSWGVSRDRAVTKGHFTHEGVPFTAMTVMNAGTGKLLALASIPQVDPNTSLDRIRGDFPTERDARTAHSSTWAFRNRTIGSTIKPLTFAALSAGLDDENFRVHALRINEQRGVGRHEGTSRYRVLGDYSLPRGIALLQSPRQEVDMAEYLRDSRTWPAVVTGMLGMATDKSTVTRMFGGAGRDVHLNGRWRALTVTRGTSPIRTQAERASSQGLADTVLFRQIESLFGPYVASFNVARQTKTSVFAESFLDPLKLSSDEPGMANEFTLPEIHWADTTLLTDIDRGLVRYLIGGGECRWNAVTMAANMARLVTGRRVEPTLSAAALQKSPPPMPSPISDPTWRRNHLMGPLSRVTTLSGAPQLYALAARSGLKLVMKTGTIDDGTGNARSRESEMLMFALGRTDAQGNYIPNRTVTGFISIRSSKSEQGEMVKSDLVQRLLPVLIQRLSRGS